MSNKEALKKMSELLRSGAVMLPEKCPVKNCSMPLFRLRTGEVVCPVHGRVYLVRSDEEAREVLARVSASKVLEALENKVLEILSKAVESPEERGYREIIGWLEVLERIRRIKKELGTKT
ncbi:hypothetical protein J4526_03495 [Desulfurococcaceae archaeon MEX13E-LK6-19]|nr:hypothetical protein J4526_03495 [Desulfurococcaceae archaeon MEX13E-LK6-19]